MARNGEPPMPREGRECKVPYCKETSIQKALFCATHELLWVATGAPPSYGLKPKWGRRYRKFLKAEGDKLDPYAGVMAAMQHGRMLFIRGGGKPWRMPSGK